MHTDFYQATPSDHPSCSQCLPHSLYHPQAQAELSPRNHQKISRGHERGQSTIWTASPVSHPLFGFAFWMAYLTMLAPQAAISIAKATTLGHCALLLALPNPNPGKILPFAFGVLALQMPASLSMVRNLDQLVPPQFPVVQPLCSQHPVALFTSKPLISSMKPH